MSFLTELKQRKVVRVGTTYAVVAWLLIEVVSVVLPALRLPDWTVTFTTILLLLGFPVALVLAWSFDVVRDRGRSPASPLAAPDARCVAVLPFANMSEESAQTHFADGLVEDILTRLQSIPRLKIVSRQSAFAYKGRSVDTRTIARELGCRYLVEGSVRRIDDRMRVTAQLIDAAADQHLWAERYDRRINDAFELQDEICEQVVAAIQARLAPDAAATVDGAESSLEAIVPDASAHPGRRTAASRLLAAWWTIPALAALLGMAALLTWTVQQRSRERWARAEAPPQLQALIAQDDYAGAFDLAQRIKQVVPNDPQLRALEPSFSAQVQLATGPAGAQAFFRPYGGADSDWRLLGQTPLAGVPVPIGVGVWRLELAGRSTALRVFRNPGAELRSYRDSDLIAEFQGVDFTLHLPDAATAPKEMVFVPATNLLVTLVSDGKPVELPAYFIDRFEVTNREYREFVDAGGYREAAYWQDLPFGDAAGPWQEAVARLVDATGRPGPATWESGAYPDGASEQPVAGVSWFEAMAYARFRGKELPTAFHWYRAAYSLSTRPTPGTGRPATAFAACAPCRVARSERRCGSRLPRSWWISRRSSPWMTTRTRCWNNSWVIRPRASILASTPWSPRTPRGPASGSRLRLDTTKRDSTSSFSCRRAVVRRTRRSSTCPIPGISSTRKRQTNSIRHSPASRSTSSSNRVAPSWSSPSTAVSSGAGPRAASHP